MFFLAGEGCIYFQAMFMKWGKSKSRGAEVSEENTIIIVYSENKNKRLLIRLQQVLVSGLCS